MKNVLLPILLSLFCHELVSQTQLPSGTEYIPGYVNGISFLLKDKNGVYWEGFGALNFNGSRYNKGLSIMKNNTWTSVYPSGTFTDAMESGNSIYFTAYDGIYTFDGTNFSVDNSITLNTCIASYNGKMMVGSFGNGLWEKGSGGYNRLSISVNGKSYDSIYSLASSGNELWIGTNNGLILYDGTNYTKYDLPSKNSSDINVVRNQKSVISVQKDKDGKVWALNRNYIDSIECLYFLKNGVFTKAIDYYKDICIEKVLIPTKANKLALNKTGQLIVGMDWGILQLEDKAIQSYQVAMPQFGGSFSRNAVNTIAYCDKDGKLYNCNNSSGIIKIDPDTYSNSIFQHNGNINYNTIDINDIKSSVANTGINFDWINRSNPTLNMPVFSIPSIGCATPLFSAALWMGGQESGSGNLHLAAETYRQRGIDFKPGPIDLVTMTYDSIDNSFYNRIWKIDRETIDLFKANRTQPSYVIPKEILEWPAHGTGNFSKNLAPFVDVDLNGKYEPTKGDYPLIKGDQMLWWVFNDLGAHTETGGASLGVEVHGSCYAYYYRDLPTTDSNYIVNRTILFDYKIINRSNNDYNNFYTGIWNDVDLGNYADDLIGCDTQQNTGYGYNGYNYDQGPFGFGKNPPVIFCKLLNRKMNSFVYYQNNTDPINGNPDNVEDYYNYMQSRWQNGTLINTSIYSGRICDSSTQKNITPGDRRFLMSTYSPSLKKDSIKNLEFAYILLYDENIDFLNDNCEKPGQTLRRVQNWYDKKSFPSRPYYGAKLEPVTNQKHSFVVYPNPGNDMINIKSDIETKSVKSIEIIDNTGKMVYHSTSTGNDDTFSVSINISSLSSGIYLVKINSMEGVLVGKLIRE